MPIAGLGARPRLQVGKKGGIREIKIEDTNGTGNTLARERGLSQMYRSASEIPEQEHRDRRDLELERLHRLVRDLELEVWGRHRRRNHDESQEGFVHTGDSHGEASYQSGSR